MFGNRKAADVSILNHPALVVVVDTEEDFDWGAEPRRENSRVDSIEFVYRVQAIFDSYDVRPCYVVDYPVVDQSSSKGVLKEISDSGRCEIGAHLHPWVTPPYVEPLSRRNMYPGNLEPAVELEKLARLALRIEEAFGLMPKSYKAGRYGFGPSTAVALEQLGFEVDLSICPAFDHGADGGPDFSGELTSPFWFGQARRLLEIPLSSAFVGWAGPARRPLYSIGSQFEKLKVPGILSRLGAVDRLMLSPEGFSHAEHRALTKSLLAAGVRTFTWSFHSSSVMPGSNPYVRDKSDLSKFLDSFRRYFDFFLGELGGVATTPSGLRTQLEHTAC